MITILGQTLLPFLAVVAAASDVLTLRIPNWLNALIALTFFPMALATGMPAEAIFWHCLTGFAVLIVGFGLFSGGVIGGGDAKLLAATALWIGNAQLLPYLVFTALAGGALVVVMQAWRLFRIEGETRELGWAKRLFGFKMDLPYGVAIAAGTILALPGTWWMALSA